MTNAADRDYGLSFSTSEPAASAEISDRITVRTVSEGIKGSKLDFHGREAVHRTCGTFWRYGDFVEGSQCEKRKSHCVVLPK